MTVRWGESSAERHSRVAAQVREKIEVAGREPRWEFSKTALFERSAHIGDMCARMLAALDTFHGLRATLGPRLEAMTGNSQVCPVHYVLFNMR